MRRCIPPASDEEPRDRLALPAWARSKESRPPSRTIDPVDDAFIEPLRVKR